MDDTDGKEREIKRMGIAQLEEERELIDQLGGEERRKRRKEGRGGSATRILATRPGS